MGLLGLLGDIAGAGKKAGGGISSLLSTVGSVVTPFAPLVGAIGELFGSGGDESDYWTRFQEPEVKAMGDRLKSISGRYDILSPSAAARKARGAIQSGMNSAVASALNKVQTGGFTGGTAISPGVLTARSALSATGAAAPFTEQLARTYELEESQKQANLAGAADAASRAGDLYDRVTYAQSLSRKNKQSPLETLLGGAAGGSNLASLLFG